MKPAASPSSHSLLTGEHEDVMFLTDAASGLRAILAIHDTSRGPALGGIRCRKYDSEEQALADALRLARAMTRKTALAGIPAGGGKAVIFDHPGMRRAAAYRALGRRIDSLGGRFFSSGDLGTSNQDLAEVARVTSQVTDAARDKLGDLAERTAEGVFLAAGTCMDVLGLAEWNGRRIAIQGLGKIGLHLATMAARNGAEVIACDSDGDKVTQAVDSTPMKVVNPDEIYSVSCDVFSPCAIGGVLDAAVIEQLRCRAVVGAANEALADEAAGDLLHDRGILFAPDVITSAGAVIMGCRPALPDFDAPKSLAGISPVLRDVLMESLERNVAPVRIAHAKADAIWQGARAARSDPFSG